MAATDSAALTYDDILAASGLTESTGTKPLDFEDVVACDPNSKHTKRTVATGGRRKIVLQGDVAAGEHVLVSVWCTSHPLANFSLHLVTCSADGSCDTEHKLWKDLHAPAKDLLKYLPTFAYSSTFALALCAETTGVDYTLELTWATVSPIFLDIAANYRFFIHLTNSGTMASYDPLTGEKGKGAELRPMRHFEARSVVVQLMMTGLLAHNRSSSLPLTPDGTAVDMARATCALALVIVNLVGKKFLELKRDGDVAQVDGSAHMIRIRRVMEQLNESADTDDNSNENASSDGCAQS